MTGSSYWECTSMPSLRGRLSLTKIEGLGTQLTARTGAQKEGTPLLCGAGHCRGSATDTAGSSISPVSLFACQWVVGVAEGAVVLVEKTIWVRSTEDSATSDPSMPPLLCDVEWSLDYKGTTRLEKQLANLLWRATVFVEDRRLSSWSAENILCVDDTASVRQWPGNGNDFCAVVATGAKLGDVFRLEPPDEYIYGGYRLRFVLEDHYTVDMEGVEQQKPVWGYADFILPARVVMEEDMERKTSPRIGRLETFSTMEEDQTITDRTNPGLHIAELEQPQNNIITKLEKPEQRVELPERGIWQERSELPTAANAIELDVFPQRWEEEEEDDSTG
ncbi:hypothetical protein B0T09DRAFT_317527 [Sordaria sp. MPI-SDFR-AT-0083]|nr:hypothetical protein B0T09DRAFT_317527 [Sordaria sp. MPI-SDFR-AT-0083]